MSVNSFSRILESLTSGNRLLRAISKTAPTPMAHAIQECLNHYETITLMAKESLEKAKKYKAKAMEFPK